MSLRLGHRIAPPRFLMFAGLLAVLLPVGVDLHGWSEGAMLAFDAAALAFLLSCVPLVRNARPDVMRRIAAANDANRVALLALTAVTTTAILVAVAGELSGRPDTLAIVIVVMTLALAWLFSNVVYALHYAHLYYLGDAGGLTFPGCDTPDYADFLYFSVTMGMTFQTSDVTVETRAMRRVATGHALAAFVFNLGVVAFTVNVLGN